MNRAEAMNTVSEAFNALPKRAQENLRWHGRNGTRVACGEWAYEYVTSDGYG